MAPAKGKVKEDAQWNTSWWDFFSLAEHSARPVEWSNSSVIFSAHPTQPIIAARHFSSSKQFSLPSPTLVLTSPSSYLPPTVISASPDDEWLFAYYPGNTSDGISCIWKRGASIDAWSVQEWWSLAPSAGIVAASWLGTQREWSSVQSGASVRLEPRGPRTPVSNPTLALVTQNLQFTLCYFRFYVPSLKMMSVSLLHADAIDEGKPNSPYEPVVDGNTIKVCVNAAIGLAYNESSILIATRSQISPTPSVAPNSQFNPIDLSMPLDMAQPQPDLDIDVAISNACGEEPIIDLCEIQLHFDLAIMRLSSLPLSSIRHKSPKLTNLNFLISPPPPQTKHGSIYLAASFLDFGDFSAIPKSDLVLYSLSKTDSQDSSRSSWQCKQEVTRRFPDQVLSFVVPSKPSSECSVFIGLMNTSGDLQRATSKSKQVPVGSINVLKIPDLGDSEAWEPSQIFSTREKAGREATLSAAMSPNEVLLCTSSSSLWSSQTCIHSLPRRRISNTGTVHPPLAVALARAVTLRKTTADLTHTLARPSMSLSNAIDVLYHTYTILELQENGMSGSLMLEAIGLTMEIFKTSAGHISKETEKLTDRWHAAHDMCSLAALNDAFNSCREGEGYDLNAVWQLVGISTWTVHFVESLLKECVLSYDLEKPAVKVEEPSTLTHELQDLDSPILLHLTHPAALKSLKTAVGHVCRFRNFLKSVTGGNDNAQIAKDVLMELVDSSGVEFGAFEKLLSKFTEAVKPISADDLRRMLASCQPTAAVQGYLRHALQIMSQSTVIDKARLFIKPSELVDGIGRLGLEASRKDKDKDVISKAILTKRGNALSCLRCGGHTEIKAATSSGHASMRWFGWEKTWVKRCICGGSWIGQTPL